MKMVHRNLAQDIEWDENNCIWEMIAENQIFLRALYQGFTDQNSEMTLINFLDNGKVLKIDSDVEVIFNPLDLDFNNKKALSALLKLLKESSLAEDLYLETNQIRSAMIVYLEKLIADQNLPFDVALTDDVPIDALAKIAGININSSSDNYLEKLIDYMKMMIDLVKTSIFVLFNLRSILTLEESEQFAAELSNLQINVLLIENTVRPILPSSKRVLIDADLCEI